MPNPTMVKWLIGLSAIAVIAVSVVAALVWSPGAVKDETPPPSTRIPSAVEGLPPAVEPDVRAKGPLSLAELRWCMTEEVRLEAIRPQLATQPAVDRYNQLAADYNNRCGRRNSSDEERDRLATDIAASRQSIEAAAIEDIQRLNDAVPVSRNRVQNLLSMLGYDPGAVDGVYGEQTREAIKSFQRQEGIPVDGLLSQELLDQLIDALARYQIRIERCRMRSLRDTSEQQGAVIQC
jgi:hypothetical protein